MTKANRRKRRRQALPPYESSEQLEARLKAFALATREWAINAAKIPFPDNNISVLAGPTRRVRPKPPASKRGRAIDSRPRDAEEVPPEESPGDADV
ncbi:hypothetical protein ACFQ3P_41885 [Paraburkholderia sabiae]|uniref:Uncharacterized protein n=1 Tax=Paraburkholderia sabiae TaxID=273251 RepID=A0ABU9QT77_9BURK|nr:hypothetical protein [Paraburkholderia sabiae]WJZ72171.1 hypothetical protein QEN71_18505 [Paraburkholderia sabiae]CAD6563129.1 hypothetical protein LMG24235_08371 [Paraburkholderia sabiae]